MEKKIKKAHAAAKAKAGAKAKAKAVAKGKAKSKAKSAKALKAKAKAKTKAKAKCKSKAKAKSKAKVKEAEEEENEEGEESEEEEDADDDMVEDPPKKAKAMEVTRVRKPEINVEEDLGLNPPAAKNLKAENPPPAPKEQVFEIPEMPAKRLRRQVSSVDLEASQISAQQLA